MEDYIVEIKDVKKYYAKRAGLFLKSKDLVKAVDDVSFSVEKGRTFGLVGESGSGKTTVAKLVVGILTPDSGEITLKGDSDIVFQDPFSSLNPRMTVNGIIGESLYIRGLRGSRLKDKVKDSLNKVKLEYKGCMNKYPHQFSGGERQRIAIARALIRRPEILVLDEPVSSLDVSIQAGILNLFKDLQKEMGLTYIFISHDLRVVEFMSDTVGVMKDGKIVEISTKEGIYNDPRSEYTKKLLKAIPKL